MPGSSCVSECSPRGRRVPATYRQSYNILNCVRTTPSHKSTNPQIHKPIFPRSTANVSLPNFRTSVPEIAQRKKCTAGARAPCDNLKAGGEINTQTPMSATFTFVRIQFGMEGIRQKSKPKINTSVGSVLHTITVTAQLQIKHHRQHLP